MMNGNLAIKKPHIGVWENRGRWFRARHKKSEQYKWGRRRAWLKRDMNREIEVSERD